MGIVEGKGNTERLTYKTNGKYMNTVVEQAPPYAIDCDIDTAITKLAEYENLEEQKKLLTLPCAVGDTVYRISKGAKQLIIPLQVMNFKIFNNNLVESFKMECVDEWGGGYTYHKTDIGRDVFFTHQEAEVKLAEMEGKK